MYSLKSNHTITYINPLDTAIDWPDSQEEYESLADKYSDTLDVNLLPLKGTPIKWTLRPLTPSQLSWTVGQALDRDTGKVDNDSWTFHLALAGVVGVEDAPADMPQPGFVSEGKRLRYLDPQWLDAIGAPVDYINAIGLAVMKISTRDSGTEKNSYSLSVNRR